MWTKSACVVLAWSILLILVTAGTMQSHRPVQANIRSATSTEVTLTSALSPAAASGTAASSSAKYVVQYGDTLSGIAARFGVRGGWPAIYAANRQVIGSDPNVIHSGTVLVLPSRNVPARYTVASGDSLSRIAAELSVRGGWPALYAANRRVIGSNPNAINPGTVLTIPGTAAPSRPQATLDHHPLYPASPPGAAPTGRHPTPPVTTRAPAGMPQWLKTMLLAVGLLVAAFFLAEPLLLIRRRRRRAATGRAELANAETGRVPDPAPPEPDRRRIVLADYDRLVVTCRDPEDTIYVFRPPQMDPKAILVAARLVLPEGRYGELATLLGMPASWPIVLADYARVVVTCSKPDDTVYVLRPPGEDPRVILRAARLVLPEGPYGELADQLGVPANWPMDLADVGEMDEMDEME
jgi:LysM repeat protein